MQKQTLTSGILDGADTVITAESGSGKSLSYILPVLNALYGYKESNPESSHFVMEEANEDLMFQNSDELYYKARKNKSQHVGPFKGAVVLSYSKELVNQIYA